MFRVKSQNPTLDQGVWAKSRQGLSVKWVLKVTHRWLGLALFVPLMFMGLTGSFLVASSWVEQTPVPSVGSMPLSVQALTEKAISLASDPKMQVSFIRLGATDHDPVTVMLSTPQGEGRKSEKSAGGGAGGTEPQKAGGKGGGAKRMKLTLDPVTGEKMPETTLQAISSFMLQYHSHLFIRDWGGRSVVGWFGVGMLFFGISGIVLWWPKQGQLKRSLVMKKGVSGYRWWRDLHSVTGIWAGTFLMVSSFTGVSLAFPEIVEGGIRLVISAEDTRKSPTLDPLTDEQKQAGLAGQKAPVTEVVQLAQDYLTQQGEQSPILKNVMFPLKETQPYRIGFMRSSQSEGSPALSVFVDPVLRLVVGEQDPQEWTIGQTLIAWMRPLHEGDGLGGFWQFSVFLTGLLPTIFGITGLKMWLLKRKRG